MIYNLKVISSILFRLNLGFISLTVPRFKVRLQILTPSDDLFTNLDAVKVADVLLILHPSDVDEGYSLSNNPILSCIYNHCLPTTMHVVYETIKDIKRKQRLKKILQKAIDEKFADEKLHLLSTSSDVLQLLQLITNCKKRRVLLRANRSLILAESFHYDSSTKSMRVKGYVRSNPLDVNRLIHLPGWDDYQISSIKILDDPRPINKANHQKQEVKECQIIKPDPMKQESLERENAPDPMEGEQTWPTPEELAASASQSQKKLVRVPKGTSDYQAAWIVDDKEEDEEGQDPSDSESDSIDENLNEISLNPLSLGSEDGSDNESKIDDDEEYETLTITEGGEDITNYDEKMDTEEEKNQLLKFREARENEMFPDEIDTPQDVPARVRFARYRGLKSFIHSPWDPKENLPSDYSRIFQFENFVHTRKKLIRDMKNNENAVAPGNYVEIILDQVPQEVWQSYDDKTNGILVLVSLLPHEHKMSVLNVAVNRTGELEEPIKSKDQLIFHLGFRRFKACPIFSQHTNGDRFKFERFLPKDGSVVATFFGPITYPPAACLIFKETNDGSHKVIGNGSLLGVNPDRVVIKRIRLSGHPFKIVKKGAVVRYMFFNREDIKWFRPVELRSKYGRHGHIREPLGTHGHMKCIFDRPLTANDTVLMNLYKRVFPKWSFEPKVTCPSTNRLMDTESV